MEVKPAHLLRSLGYLVDGQGNITPTINQLALLSLEDTEEGGLLRIHGNADNLFFQEDVGDEGATSPVKVTQKYVYFRGVGGEFRLSTGEFIENALRAFGAYNVLIKRGELRG